MRRVKSSISIPTPASGTHLRAEVLSGGSRKRFQKFSFVSETHTRRGRFLGTNNFDVPPSDGSSLDGLHALQEFARAIQGAEGDPMELDRIRLQIRETIIEAAHASATEPANKPSRWFAAMDFLNTAADLLTFAIKRTGYCAFLPMEIDRAREAHARAKEYEEQRKRDAIARGIATRRARKAALKARRTRKTEASQGGGAHE